MDALTPVQIYSFHIIRDIETHSSHLFIGDIWQPDRDVFIIGWTAGLLCCTTNRQELYLSISRNYKLFPGHEEFMVDASEVTDRGHYFAELKKDFLIYAQRDQRQPPQGIDDLIQTKFLPAGSGFYVAKGEPIYFRCGAMNKSGWTSTYDIFATLYWVERMSQPHIGAPLSPVDTNWREVWEGEKRASEIRDRHRTGGSQSG